MRAMKPTVSSKGDQGLSYILCKFDALKIILSVCKIQKEKFAAQQQIAEEDLTKKRAQDGQTRERK